MGPISNDLLIHFLKHRILKTGLTLRGLASQIHVAEDELRDVIEKRRYASVSLLAKLGIAFGEGWKQVAMLHMSWRFDHEFSKTGKPNAPVPEKAANLFQMLAIAKQFIRENVGLNDKELTEMICAHLPLEGEVVRNQIAHVRNEKSGDYRFYG